VLDYRLRSRQTWNSASDVMDDGAACAGLKRLPRHRSHPCGHRATAAHQSPTRRGRAAAQPAVRKNIQGRFLIFMIGVLIGIFVLLGWEWHRRTNPKRFHPNLVRSLRELASHLHDDIYLAKRFALDIPSPSLCQTVSGMVPLMFHQPGAAHERLLRSPPVLPAKINRLSRRANQI
jgi:hypothetical protein